MCRSAFWERGAGATSVPPTSTRTSPENRIEAEEHGAFVVSISCWVGCLQNKKSESGSRRTTAGEGRHRTGLRSLWKNIMRDALKERIGNPVSISARPKLL